MQFADKLKILRAEAGLTQDELAGRLYITRQAVSNYEQGRSYPSIDTLVRMSSIFNISLDELLSSGAKRRYVRYIVLLLAFLALSIFIVAACSYFTALRYDNAGNIMAVIGPFIIPVICSVLGVIFYCYPPKKVNSAFGYRTKASMSNHTMWNYAQFELGVSLMVLSCAMLAAADIFVIIFVHFSYAAALTGGMALLALQAISLFSPIVYIELKLKKFAGMDRSEGREK